MTVQEAIEYNRIVLADGGPRITPSYQHFVVARDRARGMVLLGGLGAMGVGTMWFPEQTEHAALPGHADAPDGDSTHEVDVLEELTRERDARAGG